MNNLYEYIMKIPIGLYVYIITDSMIVACKPNTIDTN